MATVQFSPPPGDPSCPIKGMFQLFDLITGQVSSELADRIVIAKESLQAFVNALSLGAFSSITRIDFKILDDLLLKPIGIYGSREEILSFLRERGTIYGKMYSKPILRSGLYIACSSKSTTEIQTYVVYWPEDTTWNDNAASTVRCNRTIFMRYLTKLCDQLICLISTEHSELIVWGDEAECAGSDSEDEESDQLFDFTSAKTNKQEENVVARQGFTVTSSHLVTPPLLQPNMRADANFLSPKLLCGEKTLGFMTTNSLSVKGSVEHFFQNHQSASQILHLLEEDAVLYLSKTLDDKALKTLMDLGIGTRFPKEYEAWEKRRPEILAKRCQRSLTPQQAEILVNLDEDSGLQAKVREAVIVEILKAFPMLRHEGFSSESSPADSIDPGEAAGALQDLFSIYPKAASSFRGSIRTANLDKCLNGTDFQNKKERFLILDYLFENYKGLNAEQTRSLSDAILVDKDKQKAQGLLESLSKGKRTGAYSVVLEGTRTLASKEEAMRNIIYIDDFKAKKEHQYASDSYFISGRKEYLQNQEVEYNVHIFSLLDDQKHNLQVDPSFVPIPILNEQFSRSFRVPAETTVKYAHLLEGDRIFLCLVDSRGNVAILLDHLDCIDEAIQSQSHVKFLTQDKIGETYLFVFDESKRMLAIYVPAKMQLRMFVFDEEFKNLLGLGTPFDLLPFYDPGVSITHACFVHGREEILLIDSSANAKVFSLNTLQPKPASLRLPQIPRAICSSPDGSYFLAVQDELRKRSVTAYHWSTFGSTCGIPVTLPDFPVDLDAALLTSIEDRKKVHLVGLDKASRSCCSIVLDITRKATEFKFEERRSKGPKGPGKQTTHNSLINCHSDVWTRFPVVPAVKRQTITSSSQRQRKSLVFVTDDHRRPFSSHFADIISAFERTSRKPTGDELKSIQVSACPFPSFAQEYLSSPDWPVSRFRAGEWLAGLLCLIPIHIAITHENRFVPLKDGVVSPELEKSLLGAEVNRIVDSLTLGWYESIFQSYWASKPVKVVSSMGEQSVGKSFTLNHLVDTSFAESAMRTTEGVWMSVTPTEEALIVALDFEGVHSLERSAQEDTLLVLFNTAISNLVLFRNNFALSRDISGLFQSFQSSSSVLDPTSNPSLFQSTLLVIIKDVIDWDRTEVTREFALKFQKIVQDEQDANFITRLHAGKLQIIPWPVIKSREFYRHFSIVKKKLDQQRSSHRTAGEFLHTLKTLMAKLKANDWGAISQTMAAHRAHSILAILPIALECGYSEIVPKFKPLKSFDSDVVIEAEDTEARFLLTGPDILAAEREHHLSILCDSWDRFGSRQHVDDSEWTSDLVQHLTRLVDLRVSHVEKWLKSNIQRFQAEDASIEDLRRTFNSAVIDLRAGIQLCKLQCATCNLLCTQSRFHEGDHNCLTSHECIHDCTFCNLEGISARVCGQIASHSGDHVCRVDAHLCGQPCRLSGKQGCVDECVKPVSHEGDHNCPAPVHKCGQPCDLIDLPLSGGRSFTCSGICRVPIYEEHKIHACESTLCPISCQLCKWMCNGDHLHGLSVGETHLCGQEHSCSALCSAAGICQIDTIPQSIEATFTGRHETFPYTKYTQAAKRLRCVKIIEPGEVAHKGPHTHSNETRPFHYCESQCMTCGNFCILPLGHPQQEHETGHGIMSHTQWAIDSPEGNSVELTRNGHIFSQNGDGTPLLCNLACESLGRHVHIDTCHGESHDNPEVQHIKERVGPNPDQAKDWITHELYWRRMGFKDPCPRSDQANFAKCDAVCPGHEHTESAYGQPSYCTLPMFHPVMDAVNAPAGIGYVSRDGHHFYCRNPMFMLQAFHVIFVIDRSSSMSHRNKQPLSDSAGVEGTAPKANVRLFVVFSALYSFWVARQAALNSGSYLGGGRRDAYSLILFNHETSTPIENDSTSSPDELLTAALHFGANGGRNFTGALRRTHEVMNSHWSTERPPVVIFLSDGEDNVSDKVIHDLCRSAVSQGNPLSFHAVSFEQVSTTPSLCKMGQIALEAQETAQATLEGREKAPDNPLKPATVTVPSSYTEGVNTGGLADTFLRIAESLRIPQAFV